MHLANVCYTYPNGVENSGVGRDTFLNTQIDTHTQTISGATASCIVNVSKIIISGGRKKKPKNIFINQLL